MPGLSDFPGRMKQSFSISPIRPGNIIFYRESGDFGEFPGRSGRLLVYMPRSAETRHTKMGLPTDSPITQFNQSQLWK